jgi:isopentenyldiphosphate isomerase
MRWDDLARAVRLTPFAFSPWAVRQIMLLYAIGGHTE